MAAASPLQFFADDPPFPALEVDRDGGRSGMTDLRGRATVFDAHVDELPSQRADRVIVGLEFFGDSLP